MLGPFECRGGPDAGTVERLIRVAEMRSFSSHGRPGDVQRGRRGYGSRDCVERECRGPAVCVGRGR